MAMTEQQVQLVIAAQSGDVKNFEQLYAVYYDKVYCFARMILKNESAAETLRFIQENKGGKIKRKPQQEQRSLY